MDKSKAVGFQVGFRCDGDMVEHLEFLENVHGSKSAAIRAALHREFSFLQENAEFVAAYKLISSVRGAK